MGSRWKQNETVVTKGDLILTHFLGRWWCEPTPIWYQKSAILIVFRWRKKEYFRFFMDSWFVSGLVEGEGCFCVTISKHKTKKSGFDPEELSGESEVLPVNTFENISLNPIIKFYYL